jgi:mono/diheme cytochrome c family protein
VEIAPNRVEILKKEYVVKIGKIVTVAIAVIVAGGIYWWQDQSKTSDHGIVVKMPALTAKGELGGRLFNENCAACHGTNAAGSDKGPPLIHKIYEPGHHGDGAFYRAVQQGVRRHHWPYGDMAPIPSISREEVTNIIRFIREVQQHNGI